MDILDEISSKVLNGKNKDVKDLCRKALDEGYSEEEIIQKGLLDGLEKANEKYRNDDFLITHLLLAAGAMSTGTKVIESLYAGKEDLRPDSDVEKIGGTVVLGTIKGDLHDIGKNLVKLIMENSGLDVIDLGVDVAPEKFINAAIEHDADIVACSALLTTAMPMLDKVVETAKEAGIRDKIKIIVGGAPVTPEYAEKIGADAYTENAAEAADLALSYILEKNKCNP